MTMGTLNFLQRPTMAATIISTWLTASLGKCRRAIGFWFLLAGNALWVVWGWSDRAYALIAMQFALAAFNLRGIFNNE